MPLLSDIRLRLMWGPFRVLAQKAPLRVAYGMASLLSRAAHILRAGSSGRGEEIVGKILGKSRTESADIVRRSVDCRLKGVVDSMVYPRITKENFLDFVSIEGLEHLQRGLEKGRGVLLLHSHFGNPQILMPAIGHSGYALHQIAGHPVNDWPDLLQRDLTATEEWVARLQLDCEKALPAEFIYAWDSSIRVAYRALRNNGVLAAALDGGREENRVFVRFFGESAFFAAGPVRIGLKTGASIVPLFVVRQQNEKHKVILEAPLQFDVSGDLSRDIESGVQAFADILERYVRLYPCHYAHVLIGRRRWRFALPEDEEK